MPSRNSVKQFQDDSHYHVYNRGVGKADIFRDAQDYKAFLRRLELMLVPKDKVDGVQHAKDRIRINNFSNAVHLEAYCLMPNHFHLMLWQERAGAITEFMRTLSTSYSMYFNRKYDRVGPLFQGRFKAAYINSDPYFTHLSRYIHSNPIKLGKDLQTYPYSSLQYYFENSAPDWLQTKRVEQQFSDKRDYNQFLNDLKDIAVAEKNYTLD